MYSSSLTLKKRVANVGKTAFLKCLGAKMGASLGYIPSDELVNPLVFEDSGLLDDIVKESIEGSKANQDHQGKSEGNDGGDSGSGDRKNDWDSGKITGAISLGLAVGLGLRAESMFLQSAADTEAIKQGIQNNAQSCDDIKALLTSGLEKGLPHDTMREPDMYLADCSLEHALSDAIAFKAFLEGSAKWGHLLEDGASKDLLPFVERLSETEIGRLEELGIKYSTIAEMRDGLTYTDIMSAIPRRGSSLVRILTK